MRLSASEVRGHSKIIKQVWDDNTAQKYVEFLREKKPSCMYLRKRFHFSCFSPLKFKWIHSQLKRKNKIDDFVSNYWVLCKCLWIKIRDYLSQKTWFNFNKKTIQKYRVRVTCTVSVSIYTIKCHTIQRFKTLSLNDVIICSK